MTTGVLVMAHGTPGLHRGDRGLLHPHPQGPPTHAGAAGRARRTVRGHKGSSPLTRRTRAQVDGLAAVLKEKTADPGRYTVRLGTEVRPAHHRGGGGRPGRRRGRRDRGARTEPAPASTLGSGEYLGHAEAAAGAAVPAIGLTAVPSWHRTPGLADILAARTRAVLDDLDPAARARTAVFFTTHSLPLRAVADGDPYPGAGGGVGRRRGGTVRPRRRSDRHVGHGVAERRPHRRPVAQYRPPRGRSTGWPPGATAVVVCPVGFRLRPPRDPLRPRHRGPGAGRHPGRGLRRTRWLDDDPVPGRAGRRRPGRGGHGRDGRPGVRAPDRRRGRRGHGRPGRGLGAVGRQRGRAAPRVVVLEAGSRPGGKVARRSSAGGPSTWPPTRSWPGVPRRPGYATNSD